MVSRWERFIVTRSKSDRFRFAPQPRRAPRQTGATPFACAEDAETGALRRDLKPCLPFVGEPHSIALPRPIVSLPATNLSSLGSCCARLLEQRRRLVELLVGHVDRSAL